MEKLQVGETKLVWLEQEGVGGFTWQPVPPQTPGLDIRKCDQQPLPINIPGASGGVNYCIKALTKGKFKVTFEFRRSWEEKESPEKIKTISFEVTK